MTVNIGIDAQTDLLHDTENEYLELANSAQKYVNELKLTITAQEKILQKYEQENEILDERVRYLTSEIILLSKHFGVINKENTALKLELSKTIEDSIKKTEKIIELERIVNRYNQYKIDFKQALDQPNKRIRYNNHQN